MNPEHKELAEKVIDFFKKSDKTILIPYNDLSFLIKEQEKMKSIIYSLENDFGLIARKGKEGIRLTDKGWRFTTFKKLEKDSKKTPLNTYQKIYLPLFIVFGVSTFILTYLNYNSNNKIDSLKSIVDSLSTESRMYKDSAGLLKRQIKLYKAQAKNDTLQIKNLYDLKIN